MIWHQSPLGYEFMHITDEDFDYMYYEIDEGTLGSIYKVTHKIDKKTGNRVPEFLIQKVVGEYQKEEIKKIKENWLKFSTLNYEDIDPYTYFKSLCVIVKDIKRLPLNLQKKSFTSYLDPKLSNIVRPKTKEIMGDILDSL